MSLLITVARDTTRTWHIALTHNGRKSLQYDNVYVNSIFPFLGEKKILLYHTD